MQYYEHMKGYKGPKPVKNKVVRRKKVTMRKLKSDRRKEQEGARAIAYLKAGVQPLEGFTKEIEAEEGQSVTSANIAKGNTVERQAGERMARAVASATFSRQLQKMSDRSTEAVEMCLDGLKLLAGTYNNERLTAGEDFDAKNAKVADATFLKVSGLLLGFFRDTQTRVTKTLTTEDCDFDNMTDAELLDFVSKGD